MIDIIKWEEVINNCVADNAVGIRIAKLAGDPSFSTFITSIDINKSVNPHYHKEGDEHYHIISGKGKVSLMNIATGEEENRIVSAQESFVVKENMLHKLTNVGDSPLILMFSCPQSHLESDRFFYNRRK